MSWASTSTVVSTFQEPEREFHKKDESNIENSSEEEENNNEVLADIKNITFEVYTVCNREEIRLVLVRPIIPTTTNFKLNGKF